MKYIDAEKLKAVIKARINERKNWMKDVDRSDRQDQLWSDLNGEAISIIQIINSLQQKQPELYFYCKYGGTIPLCSDCKRNHNNSSFKTEEITTWYAPSNGTKHCIDYIQQEQPKVDLVAELKHHLDTTPKEQLEKEWKELEPWGNIGPTVQEFLYGKQPEVDLGKEIDNFLNETGAPYVWCNDDEQKEWCNIIARHFYELGLNARKEE